MRDAFGGVFMIRLLLVFIVVYVVFAAISLNYAKAFRVKNRVISYIEEQDIIDMSTLFTEGDTSRLDELGNILTSMQYNMECTEEGIQEVEDELDAARYCYHGIMIEEKEPEVQRVNENNRVVRYNVSTFVKLDLSFMNNVLSVVGKNPDEYEVFNGIWKISGEAKVVKRVEPKENDGEEEETKTIDTGTNGSPGMSYSASNGDNSVGMGNNSDSQTENPGANNTTPPSANPSPTTTKPTTTTKPQRQKVQYEHFWGIEAAVSPRELDWRHRDREFEDFCKMQFNGKYLERNYEHMGGPEELPNGMSLWRINVICEEER